MTSISFKRKTRNIILRSVISIIALLVVLIAGLELTSNFRVTKDIHPEAPVITRQEIRIHAPVKKVWELFSDVNHWPSWQPEIPAATLNGAFAEQSSFDWETGGLTIHSTLQTVTPYESIGWSGPAFGAFAIHTWHFEEHDNYTIVRVDESMEGWLVTAMQGMFQSHLDTAIRNWLRYLKTESESKK